MSTLTSAMVFMDLEFVLRRERRVRLLIVLVFMVVVSVPYVHAPCGAVFCVLCMLCLCRSPSWQASWRGLLRLTSACIGVGIARRCDRAANLRDNCYVKRRQRRRNDIQAVSMFSLCFLVWPRVSNLFSDRWGKESQNDHPSNFTY